MARNTLHGDYSEIIGDSPQIFEVLQQIEHFAATLTRVLISGETGTGKGVVAVHCTKTAIDREKWFLSTAQQCKRLYWKVSCLDMRKARLQVPMHKEIYVKKIDPKTNQC